MSTFDEHSGKVFNALRSPVQTTASDYETIHDNIQNAIHALSHGDIYLSLQYLFAALGHITKLPSGEKQTVLELVGDPLCWSVWISCPFERDDKTVRVHTCSETFPIEVDSRAGLEEAGRKVQDMLSQGQKSKDAELRAVVSDETLLATLRSSDPASHPRFAEAERAVGEGRLLDAVVNLCKPFALDPRLIEEENGEAKRVVMANPLLYEYVHRWKGKGTDQEDEDKDLEMVYIVRFDDEIFIPRPGRDSGVDLSADIDLVGTALDGTDSHVDRQDRWTIDALRTSVMLVNNKLSLEGNEEYRDFGSALRSLNWTDLPLDSDCFSEDVLSSLVYNLAVPSERLAIVERLPAIREYTKAQRQIAIHQRKWARAKGYRMVDHWGLRKKSTLGQVVKSSDLEDRAVTREEEVIEEEVMSVEDWVDEYYSYEEENTEREVKEMEDVDNKEEVEARERTEGEETSTPSSGSRKRSCDELDGGMPPLIRRGWMQGRFSRK